ncbi:MAG TPA: hypothetical protein VF212_03740 [Longimicrobiales bacterium]
MKAWAQYAAVSLAVLAALALGVGAVVGPGSAPAVWAGAGVAYAIQLAAFAGLLAVRGRPEQFLVAWGGGSLLRFLMVAALGVWVTRARDFPLQPAPLLLSVAGFVILLVLLEPVFLHRGTSRT